MATESVPVVPSIGRIVHYRFPTDEQPPGGSFVAPAIVVKSFEDGTLNLRLFPDCHPGMTVEWLAKVPNIEDARAGENYWFWPPREDT